MSRLLWVLGITVIAQLGSERFIRAADMPSREVVVAAMKRAATFYRTRVAVHGGYVYYTAADFKQRWGEGVALPEQIWVQAPGTPTVGTAYLDAWRATGDRWYLEAATEAAHALVYGQLQSGGWTNSIDFNPKGMTSAYRNGNGKGKNNSTLDDGISQGALKFLMQVDQALDFKDEKIHEAAQFGLRAMLAAQFANGGFPQVWSGPSESRPIVSAAFPDYDWRTENRVKAYWTMYTLNDDLAGDVVETLLAAAEIYRDEKALAAFRKLGDFLILAQMPEPQPAWAQQYDTQMRPIWARKFEPPAITGRESQDAIEVLLKVYEKTGDRKYLAPIPRAMAYLKKARLPDGRLARYYELQTNKPLYMTQKYELTHDDSDVPMHYGWKTDSRLEQLETRYQTVKTNPKSTAVISTLKPSALRTEQVAKIIQELDGEGRWMSTYAGEMLTGQPKFRPGMTYLSSQRFSSNLTAMSDYLAALPN